jgi:GAF domain-containing protein
MGTARFAGATLERSLVMETLIDKTQDLRPSIRDLVAFAALPTFWAGREPRAVVESLADVLLHTLGLDLVYVCVKDSPAEIVLEAARAAGQAEVAGQAQAIGRTLAPWLQAADSSLSPSIPHPFGSGTVRLAVMPIGGEGEYGVVAAGSQQSDFPTEADRLLLTIGANQAASWLREARLLSALREVLIPPLAAEQPERN